MLSYFAFFLAHKYRFITSCLTMMHPNYMGAFHSQSCFASNLECYSPPFLSWTVMNSPVLGVIFSLPRLAEGVLDCWQNFWILSRGSWPPSPPGPFFPWVVGCFLMLKSAQTWLVGAPPLLSRPHLHRLWYFGWVPTFLECPPPPPPPPPVFHVGWLLF